MWLWCIGRKWGEEEGFYLQSDVNILVFESFLGKDLFTTLCNPYFLPPSYELRHSHSSLLM